MVLWESRKKRLDQKILTAPQKMPELWDLLVAYPIFKYIANNLTTRDLLNVAATDTHTRRLILWDCDSSSLRNLKAQTRCEGAGWRKRAEYWRRREDKMKELNMAIRSLEVTPHQRFYCVEPYGFCTRCGCKTCLVSIARLI